MSSWCTYSPEAHSRPPQRHAFLVVSWHSEHACTLEAIPALPTKHLQRQFLLCPIYYVFCCQNCRLCPHACYSKQHMAPSIYTCHVVYLILVFPSSPTKLIRFKLYEKRTFSICFLPNSSTPTVWTQRHARRMHACLVHRSVDRMKQACEQVKHSKKGSYLSV